jgi:mRNA-degrading endonuclease toxin of MazEF toxin-antitoxin module
MPGELEMRHAREEPSNAAARTILIISPERYNRKRGLTMLLNSDPKVYDRPTPVEKEYPD